MSKLLFSILIIFALNIFSDTESAAIVGSGVRVASSGGRSNTRHVYKNTAVMILATKNSTSDNIRGNIIFVNEENIYHAGDNNKKVLNKVINYIQKKCRGILVHGTSASYASDQVENDFLAALYIESAPLEKINSIFAFVNPFGDRDITKNYDASDIKDDKFNKYGGYTHALYVNAEIPILHDGTIVLPEEHNFECVTDALFMVSNTTRVYASFTIIVILLLAIIVQ